MTLLYSSHSLVIQHREKIEYCMYTMKINMNKKSLCWLQLYSKATKLHRIKSSITCKSIQTVMPWSLWVMRQHYIINAARKYPEINKLYPVNHGINIKRKISFVMGKTFTKLKQDNTKNLNCLNYCSRKITNIQII